MKSATRFVEKHGTCAYPVVHDEYEFFLTTLNVYFKYNVTEVLFEAGYVPSNSEKYPLGGIISAIENAFHTTPELICSGDALEELHICFRKNFEPCDCAHDTSSRGSCPRYVSLPAHGSWVENGVSEHSYALIFYLLFQKESTPSYGTTQDEIRCSLPMTYCAGSLRENLQSLKLSTQKLEQISA
ncbi:hypothetical protein HAX54_019567 [Datura stramonium]|uniref:Uncharacterized protein n=1 Tax=Datura stramonium TaxID=4076 RepID=A0ABS8UQJ9_DATST|nr:hypothetical protein [Datura stramonium]